VAIDNVQLIQNPKSKIQNSQALAQMPDARKAEADRLLQQGNAQSQTNQLEAALQSWQQAITIYREIKDRQGEGLALARLGGAYFVSDDYARAIEYLRQSLAIAKEINHPSLEAAVQKALASALLQQGVQQAHTNQLEAAKQSWQEALIISRTIKFRLVEGKVLGNLGKVYYQLGNYAKAIEYHQQCLAVAREIADYKDEGVSLKNLGDASDSATPIAPPTIERLQQIAKEHSATLLEYSIIPNDFKIKSKEESHESELYIWVIKPTGEVKFRKVDLKPLWQKQDTTLADLVYISRDSIGVRDLPIIGFRLRPGAKQKQETNLTEQLQQLHKLLIEPIADLLPTDPNAHVVFLPQGSLFLVPFPALQSKDGKYLIEKHTILTSPSIQVLQLTHEQRQRLGAQSLAPLQAQDALVVGNPTMPSVPPEPGQPAKSLPSLPGAEQEANAIAPLLNTKPLIGNQATKSAIKQLLPKARIIHLATHGLLDDVRCDSFTRNPYREDEWQQ
jgi:CHAT domain-containing protein